MAEKARQGGLNAEEGKTVAVVRILEHVQKLEKRLVSELSQGQHCSVDWIVDAFINFFVLPREVEVYDTSCHN